MAQISSGKGDLRGAAERLERGIEKYGAGDIEGALAEFEEALRLYPASARGQSYASFARDLQTGARRLPTAPQEEAAQEALRQVTLALDENETSPYRPAIGGPPPGMGTQPGTGAIGTAPTMQAMDAPPPGERERRLTPSPPLTGDGRERRLTPPTLERERKVTPGPAGNDVTRERRLTPGPTMPVGEGTRERRVTQPPPSGERQRRPSAPPETHEESPWDPVPLTPTGHEQRPQTSSTILGMPPLEPSLLSPPRRRVLGPIDDRQESVTREFRSATPTGPNLQPLDVPELTEDQIQGLLSLDGLPESPTTPQIELERIDGFVDSPEERMVEMEAVPTPLPAPAPPGLLRKNDTTPMGIASFSGNEFEPAQLTPTGIKATPPKPVRVAGPEDDPYADLNLLPLDAEEPEEGGTHPTNPFIRGPKLAEYAGYAAGDASGDERVDELPPLPTLPGARSPYTAEQPTAPGKPSAAAAGARGPAANDSPAPAANASVAAGAASPSGGPSPLAAAEAALAAGNAALAVDECEKVLAAAGGVGGELARGHAATVEQVYTAILRGPHRIPVHGVATANLDPRSAFLLSRIDGALTVEDVLDVSGMPRLEALRVMALLVRRGALVVK